jgi:hypothetical protein
MKFKERDNIISVSLSLPHITHQKFQFSIFIIIALFHYHYVHVQMHLAISLVYLLKFFFSLLKQFFNIFLI